MAWFVLWWIGFGAAFYGIARMYAPESFRGSGLPWFLVHLILGPLLFVIFILVVVQQAKQRYKRDDS